MSLPLHTLRSPGIAWAASLLAFAAQPCLLVGAEPDSQPTAATAPSSTVPSTVPSTGEPGRLPQPPAGAVQAPTALPKDVAPAKATELTLPVKKAQPASFQAPVSAAERISRLQRSIEADQKQLAEMQNELNDPASDYQQASDEFKQLDAQLIELDRRLQQTPADDASEKEKLQADRAKLAEQWKLSQSRFELEIQERKTVQEKLTTLKLKIKQDQETLDKLSGTAAQAPADQPAAVAPSSTAPPAAPPMASPSAKELPRTEAKTSLPENAAPPVAAATTPPASDAPAATAAVVLPKAEKPPSAELKKAATDAQFAEAAAQEAEQAAQSVAERIEVLRKGIELQRSLLASARKKADLAEQSQKSLEAEHLARLEAGDSPEALQQLHAKIAGTYERIREAQAEGRERAGRLDELQSTFAALQADQIATLREADAKRGDAESAHQKVDHLQNPFALQNVLQWLLLQGPRIGIILLAVFLGLRMTTVINRRIVKSLVSHGDVRRLDAENRARTLVSVFQNAAKVVITGSGSLMILDSLGAPITALLGGAAVFGLAVAFGAQSLIKDYFYGFMILLEQQYMINDVVKIGNIAGQVEQITLRMTVLRDLEGHVHFIPHGQIGTTTNMTHGWSRALFEIGIAYKEDTDRVTSVILDLGRELRKDPAFGRLILEDLTMLGVDSFGNSAVNIKFFIKTVPLKQWDVRREMLRRIKLEFDKQGIEIPFPHQTVYHRTDFEPLTPRLRQSA